MIYNQTQQCMKYLVEFSASGEDVKDIALPGAESEQDVELLFDPIPTGK